MRTIWQSLAWKEWHEHKWKLASLSIVLCGVNALVLVNSRLDHQGPFETLYAMTACCAIPLAIFIGASVAASERSRGTAPFMQSLPLSQRIVAIHKLLAGLVTVAASIGVAFLFVYGCYRGASIFGYDVAPPSNRMQIIFPQPLELGNWFVESAIALALAACSVYLWTAAAGVNRQDEVSAAARAALVIVGWWVAMIAVNKYLGSAWLQSDGYWFATKLQAASPGGFGIIRPPMVWSPPPTFFGVPQPVVAGVVFHVGLALWFIHRFGRIATDRVHSPRPATLSAAKIDWLGPPRRSALAAIVWKQTRESGPVVLAGFASILAIVAVMAVSMRTYLGGPQPLVELYASVTVALGLFITLVVGIGVSLYDVGPQLNTFWRSRPINPDLWFWTKFVTGLLVVFVSLYLPLAVLAWTAAPDEFWRDMLHSETMIFPAITIAIYISAVTMTCLVRHAVYAAILSIATMYIGPLLVEAGMACVNWLVWRQEPKPFFESANGPLMIAAMCAVMMGVLIVGWLAVRYDWGRTSRY